MTPHNGTSTLPPTLTPATIALIEAAASAQYGIRLKHVPEGDPAPQSKPKKPPTNKPPKQKLKPEPTAADMLKLITKAGAQGVDGAQIIALWAGTGLRANPKYKRILGSLIQDGKVIKEGKARAMTYRIASE